MHLAVLSSGSQGNATLLRAGESCVLVDAGLTAKELARRLHAARVSPTAIGDVVLTHGHLDHARGAGVFSKQTGATVHCCEALMRNASLRGARLATLTVGRSIVLGDDGLTVRATKIPHDADPTVALRFEHAGRVAVVLTDMGRPDADAARGLRGAHLIQLEFNHDAALLAAGPYPARLKRRVGGDFGHLSNAQAADMLGRLAGPELHTLVLAHLSATNNTPALATVAAREALARLGREDVRVLVASQDEVGPNLEV